MSEDKKDFLKKEKDTIKKVIGNTHFPSGMLDCFEAMHDIHNVRLAWDNKVATYRSFEFKLNVKVGGVGFFYSISIYKDGHEIKLISHDNEYNERSLCLTENKAMEFVDIILG